MGDVTNFSTGNTVQAEDYNKLAYETKEPPTGLPATAKVGDIFGTGFRDYGYGGNSTNVGVTDLPTVAMDDVIRSDTDIIDDAFPPGTVDPDEWVLLRNAFFDCAAHQGPALSEPLPALGVLEVGDNVSANVIGNLDNLDSDQNNSDLANNRQNNGGIGVTHTLTQKLTSVRTSPVPNPAWSTMLQHEFTVDFGSENNARHYFNTGGDLRISATRIGGAGSTQNANWTALLIAAGTYTLTGSTYFSLNDGSYQTVFAPPLGGGLYSSNSWNIQAKVENVFNSLGGNGSVIRFRSNFVDGHIGGGYFDEVDGTFTSIVEESRSTVIFVRPSPTFLTITDLTAGS